MREQNKQVFVVTVTQMWSRTPQRATALSLRCDVVFTFTSQWAAVFHKRNGDIGANTEPTAPTCRFPPSPVKPLTAQLRGGLLLNC